jgi:NitT/TauT family transport system ATP-binding protein
MPAKSALILRVEKLSAAYPKGRGRLDVLRQLSFGVPRGQFVAVLGPSGSGKTTLLRSLAGLLPHTGRIDFNGARVTGPQDGMGLVFQGASLMPWRTVLQNISLPLEVASGLTPKQAAKKMVSVVGLKGFEDALPSQLSGGMAQRVAIARALVQDPDLLLMDEPFGSLDAITREKMGDEFLRIWTRQHKTLILVTHDINEAIYLADRVLVLSSRPARIKLDLDVSLPRPRKPSVRYSAAFGKLAARLRAAIE